MSTLFRSICFTARAQGAEITRTKEGAITIAWPEHTSPANITNLLIINNAADVFFHKDDIAACARELKPLLITLTQVWQQGINLTLVIGTNSHIRLHTPNHACFDALNALVQRVNARMLQCTPPKSDSSWRALTLQNFGWLLKAA